MTDRRSDHTAERRCRYCGAAVQWSEMRDDWIDPLTPNTPTTCPVTFLGHQVWP